MADSSHSCSAHGAGTRSIVLGERLSIHTSPQCSSDYTDGKCELKQRPGLIPRSQGVFFSQSWRSCDERSGCSPSTRVSSFSFSSLSATGSSQTTRQDCKQSYQRDHVNHCGTDLNFSIRRTRSSGRSTQLGFQPSPTHLLDFSSTDSFGRQAFPHHEHTAEC